MAHSLRPRGWMEPSDCRGVEDSAQAKRARRTHTSTQTMPYLPSASSTSLLSVNGNRCLLILAKPRL
jgi:hypothetical protein